MATHKVPQDVEAEDKLVGFLSLKQFIMTILGLGFGYLTFFFFTKVHPVAALIWIPPTIVCFVLGLYQRKDQPVEVFLASALRYYLKPRTRKWNQEGYEQRVVITAPPKVEHRYTKEFSGEEATSRLSNLSRMMDSRGWASKLSSDWQNPQLATAAASDRLVQPADLNPGGIDPQAYMQPVDVMDESSSLVAQDFQAKISQTDTTAKQHALQVLQQARQGGTTSDDKPSDDGTSDTTVPAPHYEKYPQMRQKVLQPAAETAEQPTAPAPNPTTSQPAAAQTNEDGSVEIRLH